MSTTNPTRQNGSDASTDWQAIPASWIDRGDTTRPAHTAPAETYYATAIRVEGDRLTVKFVQPRYERAVTKTVNAHRGPGGVVPQIVADVGPAAFPLVVSYHAGTDHAGVKFTEADRELVADHYFGTGVRC